MKYIIAIFVFLVAIFIAMYLFGDEWLMSLFDATSTSGIEEDPAAIDVLTN